MLVWLGEEVGRNLSLKEMAIVNLVMADSKISIAVITSKIQLFRRTVDRIIAGIKEKGKREGAKNNASWLIAIPHQVLKKVTRLPKPVTKLVTKLHYKMVNLTTKFTTNTSQKVTSLAE